jgi:hypothetical protein
MPENLSLNQRLLVTIQILFGILAMQYIYIDLSRLGLLGLVRWLRLRQDAKMDTNGYVENTGDGMTL